MQKILVANRGEIAVRVMRTARDLGYRTVAVYSDADADALHVTTADEAVCIGPAPVGESYLNADKILPAAKRAGADAVHPGYGFLSENGGFAKACAEAGLVFIGPKPDAIELMGSKRLSKIAMLKAGVPCVPGYEGADQSDKVLALEADRIGYPVMVKASAGGGGRGMRLVADASTFLADIKTARSEALNAFGSDELILEKAILEPRHIEIQVFGDAHGNIVHLFERDCSVQRRHQKVVEEAPSPFLDDDLRARMGAAAVAAAKSCGYQGAGTVEFLVDAERNFYFLEMNTRLQVEHPVTECITGLDLVAWQFLVAEGEPLPLAQDQITKAGHAIEVRLYAEDPAHDFMPQTGTVLRWQVPERDGLRVDHGITKGAYVGPYYDPMLAKLIAYGPTRAVALRRLRAALSDTCLLGLGHNKAFLNHVLEMPAFQKGEATTAFIAQHMGNTAVGAPSPVSIAHAAALHYRFGRFSQTPHASWHTAAPARATLKLAIGGETHNVHLTAVDTAYSVTCDGHISKFDLADDGEGACYLTEKGVRRRLVYAFDGLSLFLEDNRGHHRFDDVTHAPAKTSAVASDGQLRAPMDGVIVDVAVAEGEHVSAGQTLVVMEAMKMEHALKAAHAGIVSGLSAVLGTQVKTRQILATVIPDAEEGA